MIWWVCQVVKKNGSSQTMYICMIGIRGDWPWQSGWHACVLVRSVLLEFLPWYMSDIHKHACMRKMPPIVDGLYQCKSVSSLWCTGHIPWDLGLVRSLVYVVKVFQTCMCAGLVEDRRKSNMEVAPARVWSNLCPFSIECGSWMWSFHSMSWPSSYLASGCGTGILWVNDSAFGWQICQVTCMLRYYTCMHACMIANYACILCAWC